MNAIHTQLQFLSFEATSFSLNLNLPNAFCGVTWALSLFWSCLSNYY